MFEETGGLYVDCEFEVVEPFAVQIDLTSEERDTIVYLLRPDCSIAGRDGDGGDGLSSRYLSYAPLPAEIWTIVAATVSFSAPGNFTLLLSAT